MPKVKLFFGAYGKHEHPVIWIKVDGSVVDRYIHLSNKDAMELLQQLITEHLANGYAVEFVNHL